MNTYSRLNLVLITRKKNLSCGFYRSSEPPSENKRKRKDRQILGLGFCQRTEKTVKRWGDMYNQLYLVRLERYSKEVEKKSKPSKPQPF